MLGHDPMSMAGIGREQAVVAQEMASRAGDEGGESGDEIQGLKQHVGGTVGFFVFMRPVCQKAHYPAKTLARGAAGGISHILPAQKAHILEQQRCEVDEPAARR